MRQRLAIADALIKHPTVLILDEPTIGIDPEGVRDMLGMLARLRDQEGMTILLSSHLLHQVQEVCDRVGIFVGGHLIAVGPVPELERQLAERGDLEYEVSVVASDGREVGGPALERLADSLRSVDGVGDVKSDRGILSVSSRRDVRAEVARAVVAQDLLPVHLRQRGLSLDDIYERYFQEGVEADYASA